jgi:uncharacterized protein YycO
VVGLARLAARPAILALLAAVALLAPAAAAFGGGGSYSHPYPTDVRPGDIVIGHGKKTDWIIPGYWTHTGMVAYYDPSVGDWIVVESMGWPEGSGVRLVTLSEFLSRYDTVAILRVDTSDSIREAAVSFALSRLNYPYDYEWWTKQVYGDSYYCSELVWASYKAVGGPDIDANPGFSWRYLWGVAPQEIYDDSDTYVVYYDSAG